MQQKNHILGEIGEALVRNFLQNKNHHILETRFKMKNGEIDIISQFNNNIVFTEVKYRENFDDFEGIINHKKISKIFEVARHYIEQNKLEHLSVQFDMVFLDKKREIHHIENITF